MPFDCICLYSLNSQNSVINCLVFLNCVLSIRYKCFILRQSSRTGIMNYLCTFGFTDAAFITEAPYLKEKSVTIKTPKHSRRGKGNNQLKSVLSLGLYALKKDHLEVSEKMTWKSDPYCPVLASSKYLYMYHYCCFLTNRNLWNAKP